MNLQALTESPVDLNIVAQLTDEISGFRNSALCANYEHL